MVPRITLPDGRQVLAPHVEWSTHQLRWRWLLDSWEGGEAYRTAVYGLDSRGLPVRNLIRHKREYPSDFEAAYSPQAGRPIGTDQASQATDDDYELRRARTPVPAFVAEAVRAHLSKIYKQEIRRDAGGSLALRAFWENVTGRRQSIDAWMSQVVAPLMLVLGQLDILVDHPPVPPGESVQSRADELRLGLDACVASYILPENMVWWRLDGQDRYAECLIREPQEDGLAHWRYWNDAGWVGYDQHGAETRRGTHPFGRVPIVRLFDRRRPRSRNVGLPRYEVLAELQREYYNRDSELILSDTTHAHPLLQGPEDYVQPDGTVPVGPNWLLPKKKNASGTVASYEGFDVLAFPKEGAESIRLNKADLRDAADRAACLTKPAGAMGSTGRTVAQSGISKRLDHSDGADLLADIADKLENAERDIAELALCVAGNGRIDQAALRNVQVVYPKQFDLFTGEELASAVVDFQAAVAAAGTLPMVEEALLCKWVRLMLPGLDDATYAAFDAEIAQYLVVRSRIAEQAREAGLSNGAEYMRSIDESGLNNDSIAVSGRIA
jgi:hypothetical protein